MTEQTLSYEQYLDGLPADRRIAFRQVWQAVRESVPIGYREEIGPKFLSFKLGEEWFVALGNQKNYISLYLMPLYVCPELKTKLDNSGKKLNCGKSCIRFLRVEDLPMDIIGEIIGACDAKAYRERLRQARGR